MEQQLAGEAAELEMLKSELQRASESLRIESQRRVATEDAVRRLQAAELLPREQS